MATWIIGLALVAAVYFAAKHVLKVHKQGGCVGCNESGGCHACSGGAGILVEPKATKGKKVPPCCQGK